MSRESREREERETYEPSSHSGSTRLPPPLTPGSHDNLRPGLVDLKTLLVAIAVTRGQTLPTPKETDGEEDKRRPPPQLLAFVPFTKDELNTAAARCCSDTDALLATAIADQPTSFQSCSCSCSFFLFVEKPRAVRRPLAFVKNARVVARKREQQQRQQQRQKQRQLGASRSMHGQTLSILFFQQLQNAMGLGRLLRCPGEYFSHGQQDTVSFSHKLPQTNVHRVATGWPYRSQRR